VTEAHSSMDATRPAALATVIVSPHGWRAELTPILRARSGCRPGR
jgi:hypothetical protein